MQTITKLDALKKTFISQKMNSFSATPCTTDLVTPNHNWELRHDHNPPLLAAMQIGPR